MLVTPHIKPSVQQAKKKKVPKDNIAVKHVYTHAIQGFLQLDDTGGQYGPHLKIIGGHHEILVGGHNIHMWQIRNVHTTHTHTIKRERPANPENVF